MKIVLIGRGRLATNLEHALLSAGHEVASVNSRTLESLPLEADVFIVAVKDAALADVIREATKGRESQLFVHTAGSMPMDMFKGLTAHYGVFYPMQTFSKERLVDFNDISVFLETNDDASMERLKMLATTLTTHIYELDSEGRKHLHLAAVFACNFVNHCYALSAQLLEAHGLSFDTMLPLIEETAEKVKTMHPLDAQTGPAVRFDEQVIAAQSSLLAEWLTVREVYDLLSKSIHASTFKC